MAKPAKPPEGEDGAPLPPESGEETVAEEKEKSRQIPAPVADFLNTHSLPQRYTLSLIRVNSRTSREETQQVYQNYFPDVEEIGREHGPGQYIFIFSFYNSKLKKRDKWEPIEFILSGTHFDEIYAAEKERKDQENIAKIQRSRIIDATTGQQSPLSALKEAKELMEILGGNQPPGVDLTPLAEAIKAQGENFRAALEAQSRPRPPMPEWLTAILGSVATALTTILVTKLTEKKEEGDPMGKAMDRLTSLGEKMGMFKDAFAPKEADKWDKLIGLAEVIFPPLFDRISALPVAQRKEDPTVKMITDSKQFKDMASDPEGLKKFIATFYEKFGARRTVLAMEACGLKPTPELIAEADAEDAEEKNAEGDGGAPGSGDGAPGAG